ncbi:MAG: hypothetical protein R6V56_06140 [Lentisphaeria bacterium]
MKMYRLRFVSSVVFTLSVSVLCFFVASCTSIPFVGDNKEEDGEGADSGGVVSIHEVVPEAVNAGGLAMAVPSPEDGRVFQVRKTPLLASVFFPQIEFTEGKTDSTKIMIVALDARGRMRWMQVCAELAGRYVAVLVDGQYRFMWRVPRAAAAAPRTLRLHGPWSDDVAKLIENNAVENYKKLNNK